MPPAALSGPGKPLFRLGTFVAVRGEGGGGGFKGGTDDCRSLVMSIRLPGDEDFCTIVHTFYRIRCYFLLALHIPLFSGGIGEQEGK